MKKKIIITFVYFFIIILILEIGIKLLSPLSYNKIFRYSSKDSYPIDQSWIRPETLIRPSKNFGYELCPDISMGGKIRINSLGIKGRERTLQKGQDVFRIVVLGDSITFEGEYVDFLERLTNNDKSFPKIEAWNCAVPGYNTFQEKQYLRYKALNFHPDMVIIGFCLNDFMATPFIVKESNYWVAYFPDNEVTLKTNFFLLRHSYLYRYFLLQTLLKGDLKTCAAYRKKSKFYPISHASWVSVYSSMAYIQKTLDRQNILLLVVVFPYLKDYPGEYSGFEKASMVAILDILDKLKSNYINLYPYYETHKPWPNLKNTKTDFVHPNKLGHEITSKVIYRYLKKNYFTAENK